MTEFRNFYWLSGDRYCCVSRKDDLISDIKKSGNWDVVNFSTNDPDVFASTINKKSIFGDSSTIFIHDGSVPEPTKTLGFIANLKSNKVLIVIEGNIDECSDSKVDKRSVMYKKMQDYLECYPVVMQSNGYPDKSQIQDALTIVKMLSKTELDEKTIKILFENSGYNIGKTIQELEKIKIYLNGKSIKSLDEIKEILSQRGDPAIDKIIAALNSGNINDAFKEMNYVIENFEFEKLFVTLFMGIIENFTYIMYCRMALDSGIKKPSEIGQFISQHWIKGEKNVDPLTAERRYYVYKDFIERFKFKNVVEIIKLADVSIKNYIMKNATSRFLANFFLRDVSDLI
jgi:hypothetical protein